MLKGLVLRYPNIQEGEVRESNSDTKNYLSESNESDDEEVGSGRNFATMFVAGLNGLRQCKLLVPENCSDEHITLFHLLFESQNEVLTTSMLGNEAIVRTVNAWNMSPHDAYVLGYCIPLSRCQWKLVLWYFSDKQIDIMKQAMASWGCGKGKIITINFKLNRLTSDGVGQLLSLPHNTLSDLGKLILGDNKLDCKSCEVLAHCLSFLPCLERLWLFGNQIGCDGAHLLSQSLYTNTTLRDLHVGDNNIGDKGGCSLAKALSINKGLELLNLYGNPLGENSIQLLIHSLLQLNHTLQRMSVPIEWQEFSQNCLGYNQAKSRICFDFLLVAVK